MALIRAYNINVAPYSAIYKLTTIAPQNNFFITLYSERMNINGQFLVADGQTYFRQEVLNFNEFFGLLNVPVPSFGIVNHCAAGTTWNPSVDTSLTNPQSMLFYTFSSGQLIGTNAVGDGTVPAGNLCRVNMDLHFKEDTLDTIDALE